MLSFMMSSSSVAVFRCLSMLVSGGFSADDRASVGDRGLEYVSEATIAQHLFGGVEGGVEPSFHASIRSGQLAQGERIGGVSWFLTARTLLDELLQRVHVSSPQIALGQWADGLRCLL